MGNLYILLSLSVMSQNSRTIKSVTILQWSNYFKKNLFLEGGELLCCQGTSRKGVWSRAPVKWSESSLCSVRAEACWQDCRQCCSCTAWYRLDGTTKGFSPEAPSLPLIREQGSVGFNGT